MFSPSINNLIRALKNLPSVGQRTAERFVFYWLKSGKKEVNDLREALDNLLKNIKSCEICWNFGDANPCPICGDQRRDATIVAIVEDPQDIPVIEQTGEFKGRYHVLRGLLDSSDEESFNKIKIKELRTRLQIDKNIKEIILSLNPNLDGEMTMLYLEKEIKKNRPDIKISRLARGLPMGADLQYADEITLGSAIKNRR